MSYNTIQEANDYYSSFFFDLSKWNGFNDSDKQKILNSASQNLDISCKWYGYKIDKNQSGEFPRNIANPVPADIKKAELEMAFSIVENGIGVSTIKKDLPLTELKAGSVTIKFDTKGEVKNRDILLNPYVKSVLSKYGICNFGKTKIIQMELS